MVERWSPKPKVAGSIPAPRPKPNQIKPNAMNTTDYFTNINAMFLFCIFICGLLVWAVIRGYILKGKLTKEQDSHLKATLINTKLNKALEDEKKASDTVEKLLRQVESEVRELQDQLTNVQKTADHWIEVAETTAKELEATKSKVRKRDKDGKFLPSGNGRVRTPKKLKLVTDLGENEVIRCSTFDQAEKLYRLDNRILIQHWKVYKKSTAFYPEACQYSSVQFYEENGYTIHPASDFIARPKRKDPKTGKIVKSDWVSDESRVSASEQLKEAFSQIKSESPKLVHGLTVKNPTEDEAKMIFDEARRLGADKLGIEIDDVKILDSTGKRMPNIWYSESKDYGRSISWRVAILQHSKNDEQVVTAKDFVQRMQNGRG